MRKPPRDTKSKSFPHRALVAALLALTLLGCAARPTGPALWRIADSDSEIWLFGSVHVLRAEVSWRTPRIEQAFRDADLVMFETDIASGGPGMFSRLIEEHGRLSASGKLSALLTASENARLARVCASLGVPPLALEQTRPWLAALQISLAFAQKDGSQNASGVESVLGAEARAAGKPLAYFETPEAQIRALADLSPGAEHAFLVSTLRQIEEEPDTLRELDDAWARGDTRRLQTLLEADLREAGPEVYAALITRRNMVWAQDIQRRLAGRGRIFIAVGAAHLLGPDSVVALLRREGVTVEGP